jgi:yeast amino acid transporter
MLSRLGPRSLLSVLIQPFDSESGSESLCCPSQIAAGEAKNPRRNLPKAIKRVYIRIVLFYILGTLVIGLLVPSNNPDLDLSRKDAASSPFVIAIRTAGIKGLPSVRFRLLFRRSLT